MDMKFESDFFDLIIDKSTIDALLCGDHAFLYVALMMKVMIDTIIKQQLTICQAINYYMISDFCVQECQRVLKQELGSYMAISYGTPENRVLHYKRPNLKFAINTFEIAPEGKKSQDAV